MREDVAFWREQCEIRERGLKATEARLVALAALARREHDDTNRGCGRAWGYDEPCTCGADAHNGKVEEALHA